MAQQVLHCYVEVPLVFYHVGVSRVAEYAIWAEHMVRQTQLAHLPQLHYAYRRDELRYRCHAHDVRRLHGYAALLVGPSISVGIDEGVVA